MKLYLKATAVDKNGVEQEIDVEVEPTFVNREGDHVTGVAYFGNARFSFTEKGDFDAIGSRT